MKSLMNRYVKLLSFLPGICLIVACTGHQIKGYEINGSTPLPEFEGKMVYMKDFSSGQLVDSAEIVHGKFDFSDTVTIFSYKDSVFYKYFISLQNNGICRDLTIPLKI